MLEISKNTFKDNTPKWVLDTYTSVIPAPSSKNGYRACSDCWHLVEKINPYLKVQIPNWYINAFFMQLSDRDYKIWYEDYETLLMEVFNDIGSSYVKQRIYFVLALQIGTDKLELFVNTYLYPEGLEAFEERDQLEDDYWYYANWFSKTTEEILNMYANFKAD